MGAGHRIQQAGTVVDHLERPRGTIKLGQERSPDLVGRDGPVQRRCLVGIARHGVCGGGQVVGDERGIEEVTAHRVDPLDRAAQRLIDPTGQVVDRTPELVGVTGLDEYP